MLWGVVELDSPGDPSSFSGGKSGVEGGSVVGVEIVEHHPDLVSIRVEFIHELLHRQSELGSGSLFGDHDFTPGSVGVDEEQDLRRAIALVMVILLRWMAGQYGSWSLDLVDELLEAFVKAHHGKTGVGSLGIQLEDVLHSCDELSVDLPQAPHLLQPRLYLLLLEPPPNCVARHSR